MECERCGGSQWRIASDGLLDDLRNTFGNVLYKCIRCGKRRRHREWPVSQSIVAHCPRCFSRQLQVWNRAFVPPSFRRSIAFALGGQAYRCYECQYVFVSLRPRQSLRDFAQSDEISGMPADLLGAESVAKHPSRE